MIAPEQHDAARAMAAWLRGMGGYPDPDPAVLVTFPGWHDWTADEITNAGFAARIERELRGDACASCGHASVHHVDNTAGVLDDEGARLHCMPPYGSGMSCGCDGFEKRNVTTTKMHMPATRPGSTVDAETGAETYRERCESCAGHGPVSNRGVVCPACDGTGVIYYRIDPS